MGRNNPHHTLRCDVAWDLQREGDVGRARENNQGNEFGVDKGSGETGLSSEMSVNTKEDEAFEKDVLSPSLIRLSLNKKCESMFENIFGLLTEEEGGDGYPCFTLLIQYGAEKH